MNLQDRLSARHYARRKLGDGRQARWWRGGRSRPSGTTESSEVGKKGIASACDRGNPIRSWLGVGAAGAVQHEAHALQFDLARSPNAGRSLELSEAGSPWL